MKCNYYHSTKLIFNAIDLCSNRKIRLLLQWGLFPNGLTVGINTCIVTISSDVVWRAKHMIL